MMISANARRAILSLSLLTMAPTAIAAPYPVDDGRPRMECDTSYTDRTGKRVDVPLKITFPVMGKGTVATSPSGRVMYGGATFEFSGHPPVQVNMLVPDPGVRQTDANLHALFSFRGGIFAATTTKQDLAATVATVEILLEPRLADRTNYRNWIARCRQVTGFYSKRPG